MLAADVHANDMHVHIFRQVASEYHQGLCVLREWEAEEGKEGIGVTAVVA